MTRWCTPTTRRFRGLVLLFVSLLTLGSYYCYDQPGGLPKPITHYLARGRTDDYALLYTAYSYPNVVLPFVGGWLIDHVFGLRAGFMTCASLVLIGNVLVAVAASTSSAGDAAGSLTPFAIAVAGRFVYGMGGETLTVAQSTMCTRWFDVRERAMAFAVVLSLSRVGSAVNLNVESPIYAHYASKGKPHAGVLVDVWVGAGVCALSLVAGLVLWGLDKRGEAAGVVPPNRKEEAAETDHEEEMTLVERVKDVRHVMRLRECLIYAIGLLFYLCVLCFISFGKKFFDHKWPGCRDRSGAFVGLPYYISAGVSTPFGIAIDKWGRSMLWVTIPVFMLTGIHVLLLTSPHGGPDACPAAPLGLMIWLGVAYSCCAAAIWPMLALVVAPTRLNTGYGLMTATQNLVFTFVPSLIGSILQAHSKTEAMQTKGYNLMEWAFIGMSAAASVFCVALIVVDARRDGVLMKSARQLQEREGGTKALTNFVAATDADEPLLAAGNAATFYDDQLAGAKEEGTLSDGVMWGE